MHERPGLLFSADEQKMEIDVSETNGLIAAAKITLFEVEAGLLAYPPSILRVEEREASPENCASV